MTLDAFFNKYPDARIMIWRLRKRWFAGLYHRVSFPASTGPRSEPVVVGIGANQQVALGNLAAKLLHWKEPQEQEQTP